MLVVIDDPTEGLDEEGSKVVWEALKNLSKRGRTVIVFSHDAKILSAATYYMNLNSKPIPKLVKKEVSVSENDSTAINMDNIEKEQINKETGS